MCIRDSCRTNYQLTLLGNYIFKEEPTSNNNGQQRFERRRIITYLGSRMHFFRTLWQNNLDSAGFTVKDSSNVRLSYDKPVSYTHLRAHETVLDIVCRLL